MLGYVFTIRLFIVIFLRVLRISDNLNNQMVNYQEFSGKMGFVHLYFEVILIFISDDIFKDVPSKPTKSSSANKAKAKAAAASIFDEDAPSIFDDPLQATKP